jgi:hypothetical protein
MTGVRFQADLLDKIKKWARNQPDKPNKAEAIRRLVEQALAGASTPSQSSKGSTRLAANLAAREIDQLVDKAATGEERASRKHRLIAGPKEFRGLRRK